MVFSLAIIVWGYLRRSSIVALIGSLVMLTVVLTTSSFTDSREFVIDAYTGENVTIGNVTGPANQTYGHWEDHEEPFDGTIKFLLSMLSLGLASVALVAFRGITI